MFAFELKTGRIIFELKSGILAPRRWRQFPLLVGRIGSITIPGTLVPRCSMRHNSIAWHSIWQLENRAADNASKNCFLWRDGQDNQCCVFVRALCVWTYNSEVNPIWALGRCDIADVLWAPWMMKEALVPVSKSLKVRFHLQHFSRRFLSNRWVFRLYPVYTATSSTHSTHRLPKKSWRTLYCNGICINVPVLRTVAGFEDGAWLSMMGFFAVLLCRVVDINI